MSADLLNTPRTLLILSDFPAVRFDTKCQEIALQKVEQGCGLLMIGGWESFHGFGGDWDDMLLASALPVEISSHDDRVNFDQSAYLQPACEHPAISGLPWQTCPPAVGGMNRVVPKAPATVVLEAHTFRVTTTPPVGGTRQNAGWSFTPSEKLPSLVVGQHGQGRTAAFLSDVAPHWVGGFVDWGSERVAAQAPGAAGIEVGSDYARFWEQLLRWTGRM
jgi:uncharacterized membrane protein